MTLIMQKMREVRLKRVFKQDVRRAEGGRFPYSYHSEILGL